MLRIGLTGGIGAGVDGATFSECGGIVVDGDVISREVVEPGTEGLAKLVDAFGLQILRARRRPDRPALACGRVQRRGEAPTLNGIVHPLAHRRSDRSPQAGDAVIVEDIPLLVESQMAPMFPLVVVVNADPEVRGAAADRVPRFHRGDARARIAAQATEEQRRGRRRRLAGQPGRLGGPVGRTGRDLWYQRIVPFAHNVQQLGHRAPSVDTGSRRPDLRRNRPDGSSTG